jgi:AcrR family transcriptional regulator
MTDRRQEILDAALAIADESGLAAVSMRAVAQRVGVTAMALYPHVSSKDDLLDGLVGRLLAELALPDPGTPWRDRCFAIAHAARDLAHRHPDAVPLLFTRPSVTPDAVGVVDAIYLTLIDGGVAPGQVPRLERLITTFVLGYAISEAGGRFSAGRVSPRGRRAGLPATDLPAHHALARWLDEPVDWAAEFEADIANLITLIESVAAGDGGPASDGSASDGSALDGSAVDRS